MLAALRLRQRQGPSAVPEDALEQLVETASLHALTTTSAPLLLDSRSTIALAFSCDGRELGSTHGDHTVRVFGAATGVQHRCFTGHRRTPWALKWHPTLPHILVSGALAVPDRAPAEVIVWDAAAGVALRQLELPHNVLCLCFHPSGSHLLASSGSDLHVWDPRPTIAAAAASSALPYRGDGVTRHLGGGGKNSSVCDPPVAFLPLASFATNLRGVAFTPCGRYLVTALERAWPTEASYDAESMACSLYLWAWDGARMTAALAAYSAALEAWTAVRRQPAQPLHASSLSQQQQQSQPPPLVAGLAVPRQRRAHAASTSSAASPVPGTPLEAVSPVSSAAAAAAAPGAPLVVGAGAGRIGSFGVGGGVGG